VSQSIPGRGFGRRTATVTVIEDRIHRSSQRNARFGFIIAALVVGACTMIVAADHMHPILAVLLGLVVGGTVGGIVWVLVRIWPVIRIVWWWSFETCAGITLMAGWVQLAEHTTLAVRFLVVGLVVGVPAFVPPIRRRLIAFGWCVIVRHRLRVCFAQFIIANRTGSLPLILWARPTPVGERVWVYLRPGLSLLDLQGRLDKIAVACHAATCLVERASDGNAAFLRFDIKRREVLTADVGTPLTGVVDPTAPRFPRPPVVVPTALDLPDVTEPITVTAAAKSAAAPNGKKPAASSAPAADDGDDVNQWI
jgi:hypothetical protein